MCPFCGYLNIPGVIACVSCRLPVVKKSEEEEKNEVDDLAARVGYRKYFTTRGKR